MCVWTVCCVLCAPSPMPMPSPPSLKCHCSLSVPTSFLLLISLVSSHPFSSHLSHLISFLFIFSSLLMSCQSSSSLHIISYDVISFHFSPQQASAIANKAAGAGYESQNNYPNTQIYFNNIGNIHIMRESYSSLCTLLLSPIPILNDINFTKQVEDTNYLTNIRLILKCSLETVTFIKKNLPVLVHCSHGWDRTAQVTALSQLLLDPFYRTIDGFKVLIEKEFLSFGHQFFLRCGHGLNHTSSSRSTYSNSSNSGNVKQDDQLSPIFFQFLDCTWQLLKQFVHYFEFNSR